MLEKKLSMINALAKKAAMKAGLQGITIAPKKKPYRKAFSFGFLLVGVFGFGINLEMSKSNKSKMLTIPRIENAIGEIIPIIFVKEI